MLTAFRDVSDSTAQQVLASVALALLPSPTEQEPTAPGDDLSQRVWRELRARAGILEIADPAEGRDKLLSIVAKELSAYALRGTNVQEVKDRLGERGELRPDYYKLKFPEVVRTFATEGIRREHLEAAIRKPTAVQHLSRNGLADTAVPLFSFFLKLISSGRGEFVLFVETKRAAATLTIVRAWRIYLDEIKFPEDPTPLNMLQAFVERFGMPIVVGNSGPRHFVLYERLPFDPNAPRNKIIQVLNPSPGDRMPAAEVHSLFFVSTAGFADVAIAYAINREDYHRSLARHGVSVG